MPFVSNNYHPAMMGTLKIGRNNILNLLHLTTINQPDTSSFTICWKCNAVNSIIYCSFSHVSVQELIHVVSDT
jgi:hypothetical protein